LFSQNATTAQEHIRSCLEVVATAKLAWLHEIVNEGYIMDGPLFSTIFSA
jgi:hypothetical protein